MGTNWPGSDPGMSHTVDQKWELYLCGGEGMAKNRGAKVLNTLDTSQLVQ